MQPKQRQMKSYRSIFNTDSQIQVSLYKALVRYQATQLASHIQCNTQVMAFEVTEGDENLFWERRKENMAYLA